MLDEKIRKYQCKIFHSEILPCFLHANYSTFSLLVSDSAMMFSVGVKFIRCQIQIHLWFSLPVSYLFFNVLPHSQRLPWVFSSTVSLFPAFFRVDKRYVKILTFKRMKKLNFKNIMTLYLLYFLFFLHTKCFFSSCFISVLGKQSEGVRMFLLQTSIFTVLVFTNIFPHFFLVVQWASCGDVRSSLWAKICHVWSFANRGRDNIKVLLAKNVYTIFVFLTLSDV